MTSKAAKRRAKRKRITLPGGQSITQRAAQGRRNDLPGPPPIHAARARKCSIEIESTLHESDMGRCILALSENQDRADLSQTWAAISAARRNFRMRIIGQTGDPQCSASPMIHETIETDPSLRMDIRTAEERDIAAAKAWKNWQSIIVRLPAPQMIWAIRGALDGFLGECTLWRDGLPTKHGRLAVDALRLIMSMC